MLWRSRKYILWPFWLLGTFFVWFGSSIAFAGQWVAVLCETINDLPKMPEIETRRGVEL